MLRNVLVVFAAVTVAMGCGAEGAPEEELAEEMTLELGKEDRIGNRYLNEFAGVLHFDDQAHAAQLPRPGYKVGYTFRAVRGNEFKIWSRAENADYPTTIALYGPKNARTGSYPLVARGRTVREGRKIVSIINYTPRAEGIYLVVESASRAGTVELGLNCGNGAECELGCAVIRLWDPQCGVDGVTYGNRPSAACFDVPIAHAGTCEPSCDDHACEPGTHCELQEVWCIRAPCPPQPTCVPDNACPEGKILDPQTNTCVCASMGLCITGWSWDPETCQCVSPCATVRCEAGYHCESIGPTRCVPDEGTCRRSGCSGQVCADHDVITTCEFRPEYACYRDATCARQADGQCGWTATPELQACLDSPPNP